MLVIPMMRRNVLGFIHQPRGRAKLAGRHGHMQLLLLRLRANILLLLLLLLSWLARRVEDWLHVLHVGRRMLLGPRMLRSLTVADKDAIARRIAKAIRRSNPRSQGRCMRR